MTPYSYRASGHVDYPVYKFSDGSAIGQTKASNGNSSNYRFFRIEPIKWIVLNYNYLPSQYGTGGNGTHTRLELLANDVLVNIIPTSILWKDNTINEYLNSTFNKEAFPQTILTQSKIYNNTNELDSNLEESGSNSNYLDDGLNQTTQMLYLLSYYELFNSSSPYVKNGIFGTNSVSITAKRLVEASDYVKAHNIDISKTTGKVAWWLRTTTGTTIYRISSEGDFYKNYPDTNHYGTRPAMQRGQECLF